MVDTKPNPDETDEKKENGTPKPKDVPDLYVPDEEIRTVVMNHLRKQASVRLAELELFGETPSSDSLSSLLEREASIAPPEVKPPSTEEAFRKLVEYMAPQETRATREADWAQAWSGIDVSQRLTMASAFRDRMAGNLELLQEMYRKYNKTETDGGVAHR